MVLTFTSVISSLFWEGIITVKSPASASSAHTLYIGQDRCGSCRLIASSGISLYLSLNGSCVVYTYVEASARCILPHCEDELTGDGVKLDGLIEIIRIHRTGRHDMDIVFIVFTLE